MKKSKGLGLVEIVIVAVILSITVISYLSLTSGETRWTRQVNDRARALAIAANILAYYDCASRAPLHPGGAATPQDKDSLFPEDEEEVTCMTYDADTFLSSSLGKAACSDNLGLWLKDKRGCVEIWFTKHPKDEAGLRVDYAIGRLRSVITWHNKEGEKWVQLIKIYPL